MSYIESVELVLENCEVMIIKYPDVVLFNIGEEYTSFGSFVNCISKDRFIKSFYIGINKDADLSESNTFSSNMKLERLHARDVAQVQINYQDGTNDHYMVKWNCDSDYQNDKQSYHYTKKGNLFFHSYSEGEPLSQEKIDEYLGIVDFLSYKHK